MQTFIVTVEFAHIDSVAFTVEAVDRRAAEDHAYQTFLEDYDADRPESATAQTIEEFEGDFGPYTPGMFEVI